MDIQQQNLLEGLNPPQREAVLHRDGPLLILAGAGTGKTRVITHRIAWLLLHGVLPQQVLAITFTNKAAAEMRDRLTALVGPDCRQIWVGTFHSMMVRILRVHATLLGYSNRFSIMDPEDQQKVVRGIYSDLSLDEKTFPIRQTLSKISSAKNRLQDAELYCRKHALTQEDQMVGRVYRAYEAALRSADAMDFDDLLVQAVKLFETQPEILDLYQDRFRYLLVDEYQDTNGAQYRLIHLLSRKHRNLCVVGDDDQSIYSFRGADIRNILSFEKDFPDAHVIKLEQNYRSTAHILQAANALIANNTSRKAKKLWTQGSEGNPIILFQAQTGMHEGQAIAEQIQHFVSQTHAYRYRDIAILYRVNALSRTLEQSLRRLAIPSRIVGGLRFYDRKEVKDVLAYLRLLVNPSDGLAFGRIINVPKRGIGEKTVAQVFELAQQQSCSPVAVCRHASTLPELSRKAAALEEFAGFLDRMRALLESGVAFSEFLDRLEVESGLVAELQELARKDPTQLERIQNLRELLSDALDFEQHPDLLQWEEEGVVSDQEFTPMQLLEGFLDRVSLASAMEEGEQEDAVSLISVHSAKGLEFPLVFLAGMEEGIFPSSRSRTDTESMEEERRLAYVAITRAKERLFISYSNERMLYGVVSRALPSCFLDEIPPKHLQWIRQASQPSSNRNRSTGAASAFGSHSDWGRSATKGQQAFGSATPPAPIRSSGSRISAHDSAWKSSTLKAEQTTGHSPTVFSPRKGALAVSEIQVGQWVEHLRYGIGQVLNKIPAAQDAILEIAFEEGKKRMMALRANLVLAQDPTGEKGRKE